MQKLPKRPVPPGTGGFSALPGSWHHILPQGKSLQANGKSFQLHRCWCICGDWQTRRAARHRGRLANNRRTVSARTTASRSPSKSPALERQQSSKKHTAQKGGILCNANAKMVFGIGTGIHPIRAIRNLCCLACPLVYRITPHITAAAKDDKLYKTTRQK